MRSLRSDRQFKKVFDQGKNFSCRSLTLFVLANDIGDFRVGIVCGHKLSKKAVERNRIKRRLREALRTLKIAGSFDLVVLPRRDWLNRDFSELLAEVKECLKRPGIVK